MGLVAAIRKLGPRKGSIHARVLSAAAVVGAFAFGAKLVAAAKDILVARQFGTSDEVDAFALALTLPAFAITLVGSSLKDALVPAYVDVREREGPAAAQALLSSVMVLSLVLLAVACAALAALVPTILPFVSSRFSPAKLRLTSQLSYLLIPTVIVAGTSMTWTAILNAHERFAPSAAASLTVPLVSIACLLAFGRTLGIRALALGVFLGYLVEAGAVGWAVRRERLSIVPRWRGWGRSVRRVVGQFAPMVAGALVLEMNPVVDSMMAARLHPGSIASLGYGNKLVAFAMGVGALSLSTAIFPHFSRLASEEDWEGLRRIIRTYSLLVLGVTIPAVLLAISLSEPIIRVVYQRGAFTPEDTVQVARIQSLYLLQVPFHIAGLLFVRFISATAGNRVLMWGSVLSCGVNVVGNIVLSKYLGVAGIALSTSLVYAISFSFLGWCTWRRLEQFRQSAAAKHALAGAATDLG